MFSFISVSYIRVYNSYISILVKYQILCKKSESLTSLFDL